MVFRYVPLKFQKWVQICICIYFSHSPWLWLSKVAMTTSTATSDGIFRCSVFLWESNAKSINEDSSCFELCQRTINAVCRPTKHETVVEVSQIIWCFFFYFCCGCCCSAFDIPSSICPQSATFSTWDKINRKNNTRIVHSSHSFPPAGIYRQRFFIKLIPGWAICLVWEKICPADGCAMWWNIRCR